VGRGILEKKYPYDALLRTIMTSPLDFSQPNTDSSSPRSSLSLPRKSFPLQSVKFSRSLITRLILGGTTVVVGIAAYVSHQVVRNSTLDNLKQEVLLQVNGGANTIDQWVALRKSESAAIASLPIARTMNWTEIKPFFQAERDRLNTFGTSLGIVQPNGAYFNLSKDGNNPNLGDRPHVKNSLAGKASVQDPVISRVTQKVVVVFSSPIWSGSVNDKNRKPIGVVNAPIGVEQITEVVQGLKYGEGSYAFALNSKGAAITHPDASLMSTLDKPAPSLVESKSSELAQIAQKMVNRQQGIEKIMLDGTEQYVAFLPLKEANWSVALVIPRENIESQLNLLDGIAVVVLTLAGTLIGVLIYVQSSEQAQLKRSKLAADAANHAKSEFLANMSHELRTPLNGILGYAQILSRAKTWGEKEQRGIQVIHQCGSHLLTLINDILDLSKIEARKLELAPQAIHLPSFLQGVVEICSIRAEQKGIVFHYSPDPNLPASIIADEKRLRQVLLNLLGNATKFTDQGCVTLKVESISAPTPATAHLRFSVADTGVGIAAEDIKHLFQAFEQVGDQHRKSEGTGLGLTISQQIIRLMGGEIQVKSTLNTGSDFYFEVQVPLSTDWTQQQMATVGNVTGYEGAQKHILVIDDRWENRAVILNLLEPIGFVITEANDGQEGLDRIRQQQPDLVITDLAMPVMDGFEFMKQVRADEGLRSLKIIVSSASVAQLDQQTSLDAGGDDFLAKPVPVDELFRLLAKHLDLTWTTEEINQATAKPAIAELIPPSITDLQALLELAQTGRLKKLIEAAEHLSQQDEQYQPFVQEVVKLARQFQSEQLEELLQQFLNGALRV
jgi:signal transduction histidine kinase/DNA-binding NarL/FixJ family response regulator